MPVPKAVAVVYIAGRGNRAPGIRRSQLAATGRNSLGRVLRLPLVFEGRFYLPDDACESRFIGDREVGKNFAIEADIRGLETFCETAVSEALRANGGVQTLDPKIPERAFARFAVAIGPVLGLHRRVFRVAEQFGTATAITARGIHHAFASLPAGGGVCCSWHFVLPRITPELLVQRIVLKYDLRDLIR